MDILRMYINGLGYVFGFCYLFLIVPLMIGYSFLHARYKNESYNLLYIFNTLKAWICLAGIIIFAGILYTAWRGQNAYEQWIFFKEDFARNDYHIQLFFVISTTIANLLFFFRKLRTNLVYICFYLGIILLPLIRTLFFPSADEKEAKFIFSYFDMSGTDLLKSGLLMVLLLFIIYWAARKNGKLLSPSIFIK